MFRAKELSGAGVGAGEMISQPRPCVRCGYELKGLKTGGRCPECGTPIRSEILRGVPGMTEAPLPYLRELAFGAKACAAGMTVMMVGVLWFAGFMGVPEFPPGATLLLAIGSGLWLWGTRGVIVPRRVPPGSKVDTEQEWKRLRRITRGVQWVLPLAGCVMLLLQASRAAMNATLANSTQPLSAAGPLLAAQSRAETLVLTLVVLAGLAAITLAFTYIGLLTEWAGDTGLARSLGVAPVMMVLSIPVAIAADFIAPSLASKVALVVVLPMMFIVSGTLLFLGSYWVVPVWRFALLVSWAVKNVMESQAKDRRTTARIVERIETAKAKDDPTPAAKPAAPAAPNDPGAGAYELAPKDG